MQCWLALVSEFTYIFCFERVSDKFGFSVVCFYFLVDCLRFVNELECVLTLVWSVSTNMFRHHATPNIIFDTTLPSKEVATRNGNTNKSGCKNHCQTPQNIKNTSPFSGFFFLILAFSGLGGILRLAAWPRKTLLWRNSSGSSRRGLLWARIGGLRNGSSPFFTTFYTLQCAVYQCVTWHIYRRDYCHSWYQRLLFLCFFSITNPLKTYETKAHPPAQSAL